MAKPDYVKIAQQMTLLGSYDEFDVDQMIDVLRAADDAYHNSGDPIMSDKDYDAMRKYCEQAEPHHPYFTGTGSATRTGKIKLPYPMGSLDQVDVGEIQCWVADNTLEDELIVATDKLDGASAMVLYDERGNFQIAFSRGNGTEGADISRHVRHFVPQHINNGGESFVVRGEIIISKKNFPKAQKVQMSSSGQPYKNARNMVSGLMNASSNNSEVYQYVDFVAYEVIRPRDAGDYTQYLTTLSDLGFKHVQPVLCQVGRELTDEELAEVLVERRAECSYEIDGLVLVVENMFICDRLTPSRDTLNPEHAIKYKVQDASNYAEVEVYGIEWNISKHGYLKPRIQIEPTELVGVTVEYATGFNAKFIYDNKIGPGAIVAITRSGDVIPYVSAVIKPMPVKNM